MLFVFSYEKNAEDMAEMLEQRHVTHLLFHKRYVEVPRVRSVRRTMQKGVIVENRTPDGQPRWFGFVEGDHVAWEIYPA